MPHPTQPYRDTSSMDLIPFLQQCKIDSLWVTGSFLVPGKVPGHRQNHPQTFLAEGLRSISGSQAESSPMDSQLPCRSSSNVAAGPVESSGLRRDRPKFRGLPTSDPNIRCFYPSHVLELMPSTLHSVAMGYPSTGQPGGGGALNLPLIWDWQSRLELFIDTQVLHSKPNAKILWLASEIATINGWFQKEHRWKWQKLSALVVRLLCFAETARDSVATLYQQVAPESHFKSWGFFSSTRGERLENVPSHKQVARVSCPIRPEIGEGLWH